MDELRGGDGIPTGAGLSTETPTFQSCPSYCARLPFSEGFVGPAPVWCFRAGKKCLHPLKREWPAVMGGLD